MIRHCFIFNLLLLTAFLLSAIPGRGQVSPLQESTLPDSISRMPSPVKETGNLVFPGSPAQAPAPVPGTATSMLHALAGRPAYGPLDTCATITYRLKLGNSGSEELVHNISTGNNGDLLLAGKYKPSAGALSDGLLIKLSADGRLLWSKIFGEAGANEEFQTARSVSDGGIIVIGSSNLPVPGTGSIIISKLDNTGNQLWTHRFQSPFAGTIINGVDLVEMSDQNFLFTGDNGLSLVVGKLTATGTLTWSNTAAPFSTVKAIRILEDYNGHFVVATGTEGAFNTASIFKISLTNGLLVWAKKFGGAASNSHFIFHKTEMINLRPRITGMYATAGNPYKFVRITVNTGSNIETIEEYNTPSLVPDVTARSAITPWSEAMAYTASGTGNSITLVKHSPEVSAPDWSEHIITAAPVALASIEKTADAGFITAANSAGDIYLFKTDSAGLNPGCTVTPTNTQMNLTTPVIPSVTFGMSISALPVTTGPLTTSIISTDTVYECRQLVCPPRPHEDTCLATFYKHYRSYGFSEVVTGLSETSDNHVLLSGVVRSNAYEPQTQKSFVTKYTRKGDLVAKERWQLGTNATILKQIQLADGNTLFSGYSDNNGFPGIFLIKTDDNLNVIWNKLYRLTIINSWQFTNITESSTGEIFISLLYLDFPGLNDRIALNKFDANGNLVWEKTYRTASGISIFGYSGGLVTDASAIYTNMQININNKWSSLFMKIDKTLGSVIWSKTYDYNGESRINGNLTVRNNSLYTMGVVPGQPSGSGYWTYLKLSAADGLLQNISSLIPPPGHSFSCPAVQRPNGDIATSSYLTDYSTTPSTLYDFYLRADTQFTILNSRKYPAVAFNTTRAILASTTGDVYAGGYNSYPNNYNADISLKRFSPEGLLGSCPSDTIIFQQVQPVLNVTDKPFSQFNVTVLQSQPITLTRSVYSLQQSKLYCSSVANCDTISLEGPHMVCDSTNVYTYRARKNAGCTASPVWNFSGVPVQIISSNDSLVNVKFLQSGNAQLIAKIFTGCRWLEDTFDIQVHLSPDTVNLGQDFSLCPGNSIILNAHSGFTSYLWQDGSTDTVFTVTSPGLYWVETQNACGRTWRDSILVSAAPPIPFDLGPDRVKCNKDSLTITAPAGFINYLWAPAYNISSVTASAPIVFPDIDTVYTVAAELTPGCFAYDTIRVMVLHSPPLTLGADTSLCAGDTKVFTAGPGFTSYQWNTGAITPQITVAAAGQYSLNATAANGCISRDTVTILAVYNNPVINLGPDTGICEFTTKQLTPGNGFTQYNWSTGSIAPVITVTTTGQYWVTVEDNNQCKGTDTIIITSIYPAPSAFLPPDTALCAYSTITLIPSATYSTYLWNTGAVSKTIMIGTPGLYWLQVSTANGCTGKDSIQVNPKQCMEGFYIPTGFTPNKDGKNDLFRPLLFGNVVSYQFSIYNRWGELVYTTTQLQQGWDGKVKGQDTDGNVFIWQCSYRFAGQAQQLRKGSFVLIR